MKQVKPTLKTRIARLEQIKPPASLLPPPILVTAYMGWGPDGKPQEADSRLAILKGDSWEIRLERRIDETFDDFKLRAIGEAPPGRTTHIRFPPLEDLLAPGSELIQ